MSTRRAALLTSLLLTAALLAVLPGLLDSLGARVRADDRLRPPSTRALTLWLLSGEPDDRKPLNALLAAFEREHPGVRVYLRKADVDELAQPGAVPPDVALYGTGDVVDPESLFLPLAHRSLPDAGQSAGYCGGAYYAAPLWYEPSVLAFPAKWLYPDAPQDTRRDSFFQLETPPPDTRQSALVTADELPWRELLASGALARPSGVALQQLLFGCPSSLRQELIDALADQRQSPRTDAPARVMTLGAYLSARDSALLAYPLAPVTAQGVRHLSLCRDSDDARALLAFLLSDAARDIALEAGLMPTRPPLEVAEPVRAALAELCRAGVMLPNAYAHTRQELLSLCADAFDRGEEPAQTLVRLR